MGLCVNVFLVTGPWGEAAPLEENEPLSSSSFCHKESGTLLPQVAVSLHTHPGGDYPTPSRAICMGL
jgi:hypothetical protein